VESLGVASLLGLDLVALVFFALAWLDWLGFVPLRSLFALALSGVGLVVLRKVPGARIRLRWEGWALGACAAVFVLVALAYPFSWDDLVYQVAVPARWDAAGGLPVFADNPYSGFPGAFSVLNLVLVHAGGVLAPGVFNASLWLLLVGLLWALQAPVLGRGASLAFALAFGLAWPVVMEAFSAYAELFLALHVVVLARFVLAARAEGRALRGNELVAFGLIGALAASIKLTGAIVPCLALGALRLTPRGARGQAWRRRVLLLAPLVLGLSLFYARPWLATGNPLHPYCASFFTSEEPTLLTSRYHHDAGTARFGVPLTREPATLARFLVTPFELGLGPLGDLGRFDGLLGLQFLALFAPLCGLAWGLVRGRARGGEAVWLASGAALFYAFWFVTSQQTRFLIPACALFVLAAAQAWPSLPPLLRSSSAWALPLLALASIPVRTYEHIGLALSVHAARKTRMEYLESANPDRYLQACQAILERTSTDAKVLLLFEQRGLYIPRAHQIGTPFFQSELFTPPERAPDAQAFLATLTAQGITHVLVGYNVYDPDRMDAYLERTRAFQELLVSMRGRELEVLFELRENDTGEVRHGLYLVHSTR
jgi:hypothetical protein